MSQHGIYSSVDQCCYSKCLRNTPHDLYSNCRVCGSHNQEKRSPADEERDRDLARRERRAADEPRKGTIW